MSECEFTLQTILDDLQPDPFPREAGMRPFRATGVAVAVAAGLVVGLSSTRVPPRGSEPFVPGF